MRCQLCREDTADERVSQIVTAGIRHYFALPLSGYGPT